MAIVPANEQGNNPPAWPAEGAGQGLYRPRRQGHHIADRLLAVINEVVKADPSRLILLKEAPPAFEIVYSREARQ